MFEQYDDILTIEEVAELLRIGMTQAYRIVRSGNLKGYKEGKDWKIPKKASSIMWYFRAICNRTFR